MYSLEFASTPAAPLSITSPPRLIRSTFSVSVVIVPPLIVVTLPPFSPASPVKVAPPAFRAVELVPSFSVRLLPLSTPVAPPLVEVIALPLISVLFVPLLKVVPVLLVVIVMPPAASMISSAVKLLLAAPTLSTIDFSVALLVITRVTSVPRADLIVSLFTTMLFAVP